MNEELQKIHEKLISCGLGDAVRVSVLHPNTDLECLICFLLLSDKFKSFDELLKAIKNCLEGMPVIISSVNNSRIIITPNNNKLKK